MWCDRILGNIVAEWEGQGDPARLADRQWDIVDIEWHECARLLKKRSRGDLFVRVLLSPGQRLMHGDVVFDDGKVAIAVSLNPSEVIVVKPASAALGATLALELGNLHWPTQITGDEIVFPEDGPALAAVEKCGLIWSRQTRRFYPAVTIANVAVKLSEGFKVIRS